RSQEYVAARIRAGILEQSSVDLLTEVGLGDRLRAEGDEHRGIYLQFPGERHHLDFVDLTGRTVWVYGQTEVQKDLVAAGTADVRYEVTDVVLHDVESDRPYVTYLDRDGTRRRLDADVIAGCDGSFGPSRNAVPSTTFERTYPYSWLGILADVAPSTDELIYAWHPNGFALHSMRSPTVSRLYLQVPNGTDPASWSADRIWAELALRLGHGQDGWKLTPGPITDKSVLPMRSYVQTPMRHGNLFLAGDAAHIVPPTGAKGLNLAIADVTLLARALQAWLVDGSSSLVDSYSDDALRRVWRCTHFSWWMTSMLHRFEDENAFDQRRQLAELEYVVGSHAASQSLAENYVGLPMD